MLFKVKKLLVPLVPLVPLVLILFVGVTRGADWSAITGKCEVEKEVVLRSGTRVKMMTEKGGKIIVEETTLKKDRRGILLNCERGVYARLDSCGNLVVISEKPQKEKIVIERERIVHEPQYIERPVYIQSPCCAPVPPPPPIVYAPPPPPPPFIPHVHFFFHYHHEKHHYRFHPHYSQPNPPRVITLTPRVY